MITAIIILKNEEKNIQRCIDSVKWCNEIIVIDDNSSDQTAEIAKKLGAKVYTRILDNFSEQRNFGISKAKGEWIFFIDADEVASDSLAFEILNVISSWTNGIGNEFQGFYIPRFDFMWGKELKYGESGIKLLRLAKKNSGKWIGDVHEKWKINGKTGILKSPITHYPHQTIEEFLKEINFYTDIRAKELYCQKATVYWWSILLFPISKFFLNYFFRKGFLDGERGLLFAVLMSLHSFLVRSKLYFYADNKSI